MSVPMSLLAMLKERPMYGLELKNAFEEGTGGVWPLNVGQVYTTLARLERDGLVATAEGGEPQRLYEITAAGRERVEAWFAEPSPRSTDTRDEAVLKLSFAIRAPGVDVEAVIQAERRALIEQLQEYTRLKGRSGEDDDLSWAIMLDSFIFSTEARIRWLDACEARIAKAEGATDSAPRGLGSTTANTLDTSTDAQKASRS